MNVLLVLFLAFLSFSKENDKSLQIYLKKPKLFSKAKEIRVYLDGSCNVFFKGDSDCSGSQGDSNTFPKYLLSLIFLDNSRLNGLECTFLANKDANPGEEELFIAFHLADMLQGYRYKYLRLRFNEQNAQKVFNRIKAVRLIKYRAKPRIYDYYHTREKELSFDERITYKKAKIIARRVKPGDTFSQINGTSNPEILERERVRRGLPKSYKLKIGQRLIYFKKGY